MFGYATFRHLGGGLGVAIDLLLIGTAVAPIALQLALPVGAAYLAGRFGARFLSSLGAG